MSIHSPAADTMIRADAMPEPHRKFEPGTILTLRMQGHSRSPVPGQGYFAPAVVLEQFEPNGEISVLIWDSSAGTHYNASYPIRELSSRGVGNEREMFVAQDNIGEVLFSPREFERLSSDFESVLLSLRQLRAEVRDRFARFEAFMNEFRSDSKSAPAAEAPAQQATLGKSETAAPADVKKKP